MSSIIDLSASKREEQTLKRTAERLEALRQIKSGILQAKSPQAISEFALEQMERIIPSTASTITLFRSSHMEAFVLASRNALLKPGDAVPTARDQVEARKRGEPLLIADIAALPSKSEGMPVVMDMGGQSCGDCD